MVAKQIKPLELVGIAISVEHNSTASWGEDYRMLKKILGGKCLNRGAVKVAGQPYAVMSSNCDSVA